MSVSESVQRTAEWFVRSEDAAVHKAVTTVIQMIDPSGQIRAVRGNKWAVAIPERILIYKRTFGGRALTDEEYMYLTFHEGGHLLFTPHNPAYPKDITTKGARSRFFTIWNACEDMRMERKVMDRFPGFRDIRNGIGGALLSEAFQSRYAEILGNPNDPDLRSMGTWLSAMRNEYSWWSMGNNGRRDAWYLDRHTGSTACNDTFDWYKAAAEAPDMQSMMPHVEAIYRYLFPPQPEPPEGEDGEGGEQGEGEPEQGEPGEGEGTPEQGDGEDTEGEGEQDDTDTEGDDGEQGEPGEGEPGEPDDTTEGEDADGEGEGESDDTEGEGGDTDTDTDGEPGEPGGEGADDSDPTDTEGDKDDEPVEDEGDESGTEGEQEVMAPTNIFDDQDDLFTEPTDTVEPEAPAGEWRKYVLPGAANRFATVMRNMLQSNDDRGKRRNVSFGNMDVSRAFRMDSPIYDYNIFTRRVDPDEPRYALIISVDTSGSMCDKMPGSRRLLEHVALEAAATLTEAWNVLRLPWTLFGWGTKINYVVTESSPSWHLDAVTARGSDGGGTAEHIACVEALRLGMHYAMQGFQPLWFHLSDGDAQTTDQPALDLFRDTFGGDHMYFIGLNTGGYRHGGVWPPNNVVDIRNADDLYTYMQNTIRRQVSSSMKGIQ